MNPDASAAAAIAATRAESALSATASWRSAAFSFLFSSFSFSFSSSSSSRSSFVRSRRVAKDTPAVSPASPVAVGVAFPVFLAFFFLKENLARGASAAAAASRLKRRRSVADAHARASYGGRKYEASAVLASIAATSARKSSRTPFESADALFALDVSASSLVSTASRSFSKRARNDRTFSRGSAASLASARRASRSARRDASMPRSRSCRAWRGGKARTSAEGERERDAEEGAVLYESLTRGRSEGTARGGALEGDRHPDEPSSARASPPHPRRRRPPRQPPRDPWRRSLCDAS